MKCTIGMAVYNDYNGAWFTIEALRMYHDLTDCEILVVDNYGDERFEKWCKGWGDQIVRYIKYTETTGTSAPRDLVFKEAKGEFVFCIDSHVLLKRDFLNTLPDSDDFYCGAMSNDNLKSYILCLDDKWRGEMWGTWGKSIRELPKEPIEIWAHGCGLMYCRKDAWLGFNPEFTGFGGEEGYIHEKYRQAGKKVWCNPDFIWLHRFDDPDGPNVGNYPNNLADRVRNYVIGFRELGLPLEPVINHFGQQIVRGVCERLGKTGS